MTNSTSYEHCAVIVIVMTKLYKLCQYECETTRLAVVNCECRACGAAGLNEIQ